MSPPRVIRIMVLLQAAVAAASLIVEIVAGRMLAPYVGMSVHTWTAVIAVVLAGFSAGHWVGGRIAGRAAGDALRITGWSMIAAAATTALATGALRLASGPVLSSVPDPVMVIVILTGAAFFLPSFFAGIPAPVLAEVGARLVPERSGQTLGAMFAASAFGAILGTLAAGFVLISYLGSTLSMLSVTLAYLVIAAVLLVLARAEGAGGYRGAGLASLAVLAIVGADALLLSSPCTRESRYFCIRVVDVSAAPDRPANLMVLDHLVHGISARDVPHVMFTDHAAMLDHLGRAHLQDRPDATAFFIGGGTFSIPRAWQGLDPAPRMDVAEIDPAVTEVAERDFWFRAGPQTTVLNADARVSLAASAARYDVIIGDAFTDIAVPVHLITQEFFAEVRQSLTDDGVFLMNVIDHIGNMKAAASILKTLKTVFPVVEVWTEARPYEDGDRIVMILRAGNSPSEVGAFITPSPDPTQFGRLSATWQDRVLGGSDVVLLTDDFAPIERLMRRTH